MNSNISKLEQEIEEKRIELENLKKRKQEFDSLPNEYKLADLIHEKTCRSNHIDVCAFHYEKWPKDKISASWKSSLRFKYVQKARAILKITDYQTAVLVISEI